MSEKPYVFNKDMIGEETMNELALFLFLARQELDLPISEIAKMSGIAVERLEDYEVAVADLHFEDIAVLLKLYNKSLDAGFVDLFTGLPDEWYDTCFKPGFSPDLSDLSMSV